jgi:hypothetical protein
VYEPAEAQENYGLFAMGIDVAMQQLLVAGGLLSFDARAGCSVE